MLCAGESRTQRPLDLRSKRTSKQLSSHWSSLIRKFVWLHFQRTDQHRHYGWSEMEVSYAASLCHISLKITAREQTAWNNSIYVCYRASYERRKNRKIWVVAFVKCIRLLLSVFFSVNSGFLKNHTNATPNIKNNLSCWGYRLQWQHYSLYHKTKL